MENNLNYSNEKNNKTTNVLLILVLIVGVILIGLLSYKMFIYDKKDDNQISKEFKLISSYNVESGYTEEELVFATIVANMYKNINDLNSDEWKSYMIGVSLSFDSLTEIRNSNGYNKEYLKGISGTNISDKTVASGLCLTKEERDAIAKTESKEINDYLSREDAGSISRYVISLEDAKNEVTNKFKDIGNLFDESSIYSSFGHDYIYIKSLGKIYVIPHGATFSPSLIIQTKKTDNLYTVWFTGCSIEKDQCIKQYENNELNEIHEVTFKLVNGKYIFNNEK